MMMGISRNSLKIQLVIRFALLLGAMMVIINIGFFVLLLIILPASNVADREVVPVISEAIREIDGHIVMMETADIKALVDSSRTFWFAVAHPDGRTVRHGHVPPEMTGLVARLADIQSLEMRGEEGSPLTASFQMVSTDFGKLNVVFGGRPQAGHYMFNLFWGLKVVYLPLIVIPLLVVFFGIPVLVGWSLSGLKKTIDRAAMINMKSLGERLPKDDVVKELHPLVDAMNATLARIDEDVTQRQRFLANAAHELRTPIAILQTRLEALPQGPERERLLLDIARLAATAEQLLTIQRFGSVQARETVDLYDICETVAADHAPLALTDGYELEFDAAVSSSIILGDKPALERAVSNLVRNAIEHGGGSGRIVIHLQEGGIIDVTDEGPGIPASERHKIFEPFYRVTPRSTGAGLGLALVNEVVSAHNGKVLVIDRLKGACLRIVVQMPKEAISL